MAMMATVKVSLRGTPHEWYFKAKDLVSSGELSEKEVFKALSALIREAKVRPTRREAEIMLTPCWGDICRCMVQGWLPRRQVTETLKLLVRLKRYHPVKIRWENGQFVVSARDKYGGENEEKQSEEVRPKTQLH